MQKILIANRGEIAVRILRTAKEMGIRTVAVFSEADRNALHAKLADEAYCIGPASSRESYLRADKILEVAIAANAHAIHPGYGFLSENTDFARAVEASGLRFVGPPAASMEQMGSKIPARRLARQLNVPLVPGTDEALSDMRQVVRIARETGFPLLIKASAGGGGKGMRAVASEAELETQLQSASSEALSAFGDGSVFIEKQILQPRHIEIQILTDAHGNGVYLFERECSIQRRHQKIIEEAPSSCIDPALRKRMGNDALRLALACGYVGAGTVEFLVDSAMNYYFLEMNTRLQVEHPVTEAITGLDLVRLQIEIADGMPLPFRQEDLKINGHSIELRISAEDPANDFLPSTGRLERYRPPTGTGVRIDSGYAEGDDIPLSYDPLLAKLIVHGSDRRDAIQRMRSAIEDFLVDGIETTLDYGYFALAQDDFVRGNFDTGFVAKHAAAYAHSLVDPTLTEDLAHAAYGIYLNALQKVGNIHAGTSNWALRRKH
ncbi:MAG: acetyl-CoA carboxylase biotin carboxylase subunit [Saprospiraceae bacterium]|nr:acetyl-CoA carboxylase biotin carboxylase subunit [Saprospiraceae bacterium]